MKQVCFVTTSPLIVNFFLVPHLLHLRRRYAVTLAVTLPGEVPLRELPGIEVLPVDIARGIEPWRDLRARRSLHRLFRERRFDLVHSFGPKAGLLAATAGARAGIGARLHTFTGQVWAARRGPMRWLLRAADRATARAATHVLADSASQCEFLAREGIVARGKCNVLGSGSLSGVVAARFRADPAARAAVRAELGVEAHVPLVLYLGRITRDKGVLDLARAFAGLDTEAVLLYAGPDEGALREPILHACGARRAQVRFAGYTHAPERYLAAADLLCLPSYREGFGAVIIEAGAAGVPSVASRIYGVVDAVVEGETGVLFRAGDAAELRARLALLLGDAPLRERLGRAARARALAEFSQERITGALERFYEAVLGG
jgi:glycosyltransferase involved in cell wall biosynthesis